jgi:hypothetical protein
MTAANIALTTTRHLRTMTKMENGAKAISIGFITETSRWGVAPLVWILSVALPWEKEERIRGLYIPTYYLIPQGNTKYMFMISAISSMG